MNQSERTIPAKFTGTYDLTINLADLLDQMTDAEHDHISMVLASHGRIMERALKALIGNGPDLGSYWKWDDPSSWDACGCEEPETYEWGSADIRSLLNQTRMELAGRMDTMLANMAKNLAKANAELNGEVDMWRDLCWRQCREFNNVGMEDRYYGGARPSDEERHAARKKYAEQAEAEIQAIEAEREKGGGR